MKKYRSRLAFNFSIRNKLFFSYVLVILTPLILLLFIHITLTQRESEESALSSSRKVLEETKSYLQYKSQAIMEAMNFIALSDLVQEEVNADSALFLDVNDWHQSSIQLMKLINQYRYNDDIDSIQIYMKKGLAGVTESPDFLKLNKIQNKDWYAEFSASNAQFAWLPSSLMDHEAVNEEITILRKVPSEHNLQQFNGVLRGSVKADTMQSVLNHAILTPNGASFLFNDRGDLLSQSDGAAFTLDIIKGIKNKYFQEKTGDSFSSEYKILGKPYLLGVQNVPATNMQVALLIPFKDILQSSTKARNRIIWIHLLIIPFMLPLSYYIAGSATKRVRHLIHNVRKVKHGNFSVAPLPTNEDEIGELARNINNMVQSISGLMDETYSLGREVKNKELKALQAQINPHFLYNTLDLINVMAIESDARGIKSVVDELAKFYRLSLSNGQEYVTLENELKHIEAYIRIQNMRFGDSVELVLEVPVDMYPYMLPKILLQPLVENAILHGIMEKEEEKGMISIKARTYQGEVIIEVEDNGVGMDTENVPEPSIGYGEKSDGGGYGIRNIDERLKLSYGPIYGLRFESTKGVGTRAILRLPGHRPKNNSPGGVA
ncbi:sensor histidine kinase [Cohnella sp. GCM10012308]|uniref:cache domain-containing sensor histidine kinase n=1 Tax=Cohnella sp. GCM10012308 TaxID=3317329 RepID=UPI0036148B25